VGLGKGNKVIVTWTHVSPAAIQGLIETPINERPNCGTQKSEQRPDDDLAKGTTATVVPATRDEHDRSEDGSETDDRPINARVDPRDRRPRVSETALVVLPQNQKSGCLYGEVQRGCGQPLVVDRR
jgi:hypothetical protein